METKTYKTWCGSTVFLLSYPIVPFTGGGCPVIVVVILWLTGVKLQGFGATPNR